MTEISLEAENNPDFTSSNDQQRSALQYKAWVSTFVYKVIEKVNQYPSQIKYRLGIT